MEIRPTKQDLDSHEIEALRKALQTAFPFLDWDDPVKVWLASHQSTN